MGGADKNLDCFKYTRSAVGHSSAAQQRQAGSHPVDRSNPKPPLAASRL